MVKNVFLICYIVSQSRIHDITKQSRYYKTETILYIIYDLDEPVIKFIKFGYYKFCMVLLL